MRFARFLLILIALASVVLLIKRPSMTRRKEVSLKPTPIPILTPTPTPRPLTFSEMNALYGPCLILPTLMYHHIQDMALAKTKNQQNITVDTNIFRSQMDYLKSRGYTTASMQDLVNFFNSGASIPKKSILLTFDDGYDDFYLNAYPILSEFGFKATMFTPAGLIGNPGYLSWGQIAGMSNVLFANHTWSHKSMASNGNIDEKEIFLADSQLTERSYDNPKIFAYPYGTVSSVSEAILSKYGYQIAFTTKPGNTLCKKQGLILPRVRIGNTPLSSYGF